MEEGKYVDVLYAVNEYKTSMSGGFNFFKLGAGGEYDDDRPNASDPPP